MHRGWFKNKKVVVMGLGLHGGGLAVAKWMIRAGAQVTITDLRSADILQPSLSKLKDIAGSFTSVLGEHRREDFLDADLIIQNPGVPHTSPYIVLARKQDIRIENEATLFFELSSSIPKIAVTGTRGKSTVTSLIGEMMRKKFPETITAGVATDTGVTAFFDVVDRMPPFFVVELSSWQLDLFAGRNLSPRIGVITNILSDHLDRYDSLSDYADAKKNIFRAQSADDTLILNYDNALTRSCGHETLSRVGWFSVRSPLSEGAIIAPDQSILLRENGHTHRICDASEALLQGEHNKENILAAVAAAWHAGARAEDCAAVLKTFGGLSGRLEKIADFSDRLWINDTSSSTPDATLAALQTLGDGRKTIILIAGGIDKNLDYSKLASQVTAEVRALVLFEGTATEKLKDELRKSSYTGDVYDVQSMSDAVIKAWEASSKGDMILLSPAAASFGLFVNAFDRGRQFRAFVERLNKDTGNR